MLSLIVAYFSIFSLYLSKVPFSFSVEWVHTPDISYMDRMKRYADSTFLPTTFEIHWLSIINSFVLVMLLTAFLAIIFMRILKKDFSKYMEVDEVSNISNFYAIFEVTEIYVEVLFYLWSALCTSSCYKYGKAEMPCYGYLR